MMQPIVHPWQGPAMGHVSLQVFHQSKSQACASTDAAEDLKSVCLLDGTFVEKKEKKRCRNQDKLTSHHLCELA